MANPDVSLTLDESVDEVLGLLTGLELRYEPELERYRSVTRMLNRALRGNALENEWSYYAETENIGNAVAGQQEITLRSSRRPRITSDDAVRLLYNGVPVVWAYFLPRDALHKYHDRGGLRVSITKNTLTFSRPFSQAEDGLELELPVMREPKMFQLPEQPEDPNAELVSVPDTIRQQPIDFDYPDVVIARAAWLYAQTDPIMQPRVQTLEAQYKDLMYQLIERDQRHTDTPYTNEWFLPITNSISGFDPTFHAHPHADERRMH